MEKSMPLFFYLFHLIESFDLTVTSGLFELAFPMFTSFIRHLDAAKIHMQE